MKEVYFGDFHAVVLHHVRDIERAGPALQSTEWYLLRYLRRVATHSNPPASPHGVESSMRALLRFYVDVIDETTELGERCRQVFEAHRRSLRNPDAD